MSKIKYVCLLLIGIISFSLFQGKVQGAEISLNFTASGVASIIDSVVVENITQCQKITVNGNETLILGNGTSIFNYFNVSNNGSLLIYPNPSLDLFYASILSSCNQKAFVKIYNLTGEMLYNAQVELKNGNNVLSIQNIPRGNYLFQVIKNDEINISKLFSFSSKALGMGILVKPCAENFEFKKNITKNIATQNLSFMLGDRLLFKAYSGKHSTIKVIEPSFSQTINFEFYLCADPDSNYYTTVKIGNQIWMAENLRTSKFANGISIPKVLDNLQWGNLTSPAYSWYDNDSVEYDSKFGKFYNWYAVNDSRSVSPTGWHVPSKQEWGTLVNYVGGIDVAGGMLKENCSGIWNPPNAGANNKFGFTALPSGYRNSYGTFDDVYYNGYWWTSTQEDALFSYYQPALFDQVFVFMSYYDKDVGYTLRCVKNN